MKWFFLLFTCFSFNVLANSSFMWRDLRKSWDELRLLIEKPEFVEEFKRVFNGQIPNQEKLENEFQTWIVRNSPQSSEEFLGLLSLLLSDAQRYGVSQNSFEYLEDFLYMLNLCQEIKQDGASQNDSCPLPKICSLQLVWVEQPISAGSKESEDLRHQFYLSLSSVWQRVIQTSFKRPNVFSDDSFEYLKRVFYIGELLKEKNSVDLTSNHSNH
jgi:hypothetical protein